MALNSKHRVWAGGGHLWMPFELFMAMQPEPYMVASASMKEVVGPNVAIAYASATAAFVSASCFSASCSSAAIAIAASDATISIAS